MLLTPTHNSLKSLALVFFVFCIFVSCKRDRSNDWPDERLNAWLSFYNIKLDDFDEIQKHEIPYRIVHPFHISDDDLYAPLYVYNADSTMAIDLDSYHLVLEQDANGYLFSPGREVDMEIGLIDFEEQTRRRILFCGTPCLFEEAGFHPSGTVVIAGFIEDEQGFVPAIWDVDPNQYTLSVSLASKSVHPKDILYIPKKRLQHIRFWFDPDNPPGHLDVPL